MPTLHDYIEQGDIVNIIKCLSDGVDINLIDPIRKCTPLMLAVEMGDLKIIMLLLQASPNLMLQDVDGLTVLDYAVMFSDKFDLDIYQLLLESMGNKVTSNEELIPYSFLYVVSKDISLLQQLLEKNPAEANIQHKGFSLIHLAILKDQLQMVDLILQKNPDSISQMIRSTTRFNSYDALSLSIVTKRFEIAKLILNTEDKQQLIQFIINPKYEHWNLFQLVSFWGYAEMIELFITTLGPRAKTVIIDSIPEGDKHGWNALQIVASLGNVTILDMFFKELGPELSTQRMHATIRAGLYKGWNAIYLAASCGHHAVLQKTLLQCPQDVYTKILFNPVTNGHMKGHNALQLAIRYNHAGVFTVIAGIDRKLAIELITKPNEENDQYGGLSLFEVAVYEGYTQVFLAMQNILAEQINDLVVNPIKNKKLSMINNLSLFQIAVQRGHVEIVSKLITSLAYKANSLIRAVINRTSINMSLFQLAASQGNTPMIMLMLNAFRFEGKGTGEENIINVWHVNDQYHFFTALTLALTNKREGTAFLLLREGGNFSFIESIKKDKNLLLNEADKLRLENLSAEADKLYSEMNTKIHFLFDVILSMRLIKEISQLLFINFIQVSFEGFPRDFCNTIFNELEIKNRNKKKHDFLSYVSKISVQKYRDTQMAINDLSYCAAKSMSKRKSSLVLSCLQETLKNGRFVLDRETCLMLVRDLAATSLKKSEIIAAIANKQANILVMKESANTHPMQNDYKPSRAYLSDAAAILMSNILDKKPDILVLLSQLIMNEFVDNVLSPKDNANIFLKIVRKDKERLVFECLRNILNEYKNLYLTQEVCLDLIGEISKTTFLQADIEKAIRNVILYHLKMEIEINQMQSDKKTNQNHKREFDPDNNRTADEQLRDKRLKT